MATNDKLLLVGSIPMETVEDVLRAWGGPLGRLMPCMPDGEVGDRAAWVDMLAYRVYNGHPDLETLKRPAPENGVERWRPRNLNDEWEFRVRPGVKAVRFGEPGWRLGYARDALNSYFVFQTLKKEGVLPPGLRLQVCLPLSISAVMPYFHDPADWDKVIPGYESAVRAEIAKMLERIPAGELAIQWDEAVEVQDVEFGYPYSPEAGRFARNTSPIQRLSRDIPGEVMLGHHLCYGTLGGWPMVSPKDLAIAVKFANTAVAISGRRVDFVHIPILNTVEDAYYQPLRELNVGAAGVYLGLIHNMQDKERFLRRVALARKYLPEFGLSAPCGFGRENPDTLPALLQDHLDALKLVKQG
ncbi:MAG TPA: hypothetical protein VMD75_10945 [Candidatus Binataceae bacterium]|nr:hypothetical protein [Candidatus Binataceae bacterium]